MRSVVFFFFFFANLRVALVSTVWIEFTCDRSISMVFEVRDMCKGLFTVWISYGDFETSNARIFNYRYIYIRQDSSSARRTLLCITPRYQVAYSKAIVTFNANAPCLVLVVAGTYRIKGQRSGYPQGDNAASTPRQQYMHTWYQALVLHLVDG